MNRPRWKDVQEREQAALDEPTHPSHFHQLQRDLWHTAAGEDTRSVSWGSCQLYLLAHSNNQVQIYASSIYMKQ